MSVPNLYPSHIYRNHHLDSTRWQHYIPRDDDIVISTSIKSGTTWTQGIVRELIVHAMRQSSVTDPAHFPAPDNSSSIWLDARWTGPVEDAITKLEAQPHRRFLKSHLALDGMPIYSQVKYIVVARSPLDVFMSLWNHYSAYTEAFYARANDPNRPGAPLPRCPIDIHAFWAMWISRGWFEWEQEGYPFWGNQHHTQSWWNYRHLDNIVFVHYADLLADPAGVIRRLAKFLDIAIDDETLANMVTFTSLDAMRQRAAAAERNKAGLSFAFRGGANTFFYRGTNGRWQEVLTDEELAMYDQTAARVLTPDCRAWLEQGHSTLGASGMSRAQSVH